MCLQHDCDRAGHQPRVVIAGVSYTCQQAARDAVVTTLSVPKEGRCRTYQPVIMERLYDWNVLKLACVVNRWGHHCKCIVHMHDIGFEIADQAANSQLAVLRRNNTAQ